jgi:exonuclease SbcC
MQAIRERIAEYDATISALTRRLGELEVMLQGHRVTAEECARAEQEHELCQQQRNAAEKDCALLSRQAEDLRERLTRVQQLQTEAAQVRRLHQTYHWLANDLRTDRFQAYLLEETLTELVSDASCQLAQLTGDRYGLRFIDDRIQVLDQDNAGESRGVETLSGGETFLASLSLALALSSQLQAAAGAVRLDCLFIDEGFGTLDPETLRTVADAIRGLQVGGRMVGIITHVPELKEEFDQRLIVERTASGTQIRADVL